MSVFRIARRIAPRMVPMLLLAGLLAACAGGGAYDTALRSTDGDAARIGSQSSRACGGQALSQDQIRTLVEQAVQDMPIESQVNLSRPSSYASGMAVYGLDRQQALMQWLLSQQAIITATGDFVGLPHAGPMGVEDSLAVRAGAIRRGGRLVLVVDSTDIGDGIRAGAAALSTMYRFELPEAIGVQGYSTTGPRREFFGLSNASARFGRVPLTFLRQTCAWAALPQQMTAR